MRHRRMLEELSSGRKLVVRVERMDPVKNLVRGLDAFAAFLREHPRMHDRITHFVLACTTRPGIAAYERYRAEVITRVRAINTEFGSSTWRPVVLAERPDYFLGLAALALADIVVVNSLRDGMNIVTKEAAVVNERDAVLILSRDAGAAEDLGCCALLVDPWSTPELTAAIGTALAMSNAERQRRAEVMRSAAASISPREWLAAQRRDLIGIR
jgi:trehalose 6-phosphate synthase